MKVKGGFQYEIRKDNPHYTQLRTYRNILGIPAISTDDDPSVTVKIAYKNDVNYPWVAYYDKTSKTMWITITYPYTFTAAR